MKSFGEQLSEARRINGITQERLAEMLGITRQGISNWERGRTFPDLDAIKQLSQILHYEFTVTEGLMQDSQPDSEIPVSEAAPVASDKRKLPTLIASFFAGVLVMFLLMQFIVPMIREATAKPGYVTSQPAKGMTGPETVSWFTKKNAPVSGKPYIMVTFNDNPIKAESDPDYSNGYGWNYTVYFTEYNHFDFYPETYTEYLFKDEGHAISLQHTADELEEWWNGTPHIPPRGQQCVTGGKPLQDIIGIGIKLAGKDASGEEMEFVGYLECSQQIED